MVENLTEFVPLCVTAVTRERLEEIATRWGVSRSAIIRKAIQDFVDNYADEDMAIAELRAHNERMENG